MFLLQNRMRPIIASVVVSGILAIVAVFVSHDASAHRSLSANEMRRLLGGSCPGCSLSWNYTACVNQDPCTECRGALFPGIPTTCDEGGASPSGFPVPSFIPAQNMQKSTDISVPCYYADNPCNDNNPPPQDFMKCSATGIYGYLQCVGSVNPNDTCRNCQQGTLGQVTPADGNNCLPCGS